MVYDGSPFYTADGLKESIEAAIFNINLSKRAIICNMYANYRKRLIDVIEKCG